jgi:FAD-linked sulfhydryl oxidase
MHSGCPVNRRELGRASWAMLHTMAAYYPQTPSRNDQREMEQALWTVMKFFPCNYCSEKTLIEMKKNPPRTQTQKELSQWMCEIHNEVNERLGKPVFDCKKVEERWKTGNEKC